MALNDDEKKLLAELQQRANEPEHDDDFEIEVYDTSAGKGARIPYRAGKGWLYDVFGIGDAPAEPAEPAPAATPDGTPKGSSGGRGGIFARSAPGS